MHHLMPFNRALLCALIAPILLSVASTAFAQANQQGSLPKFTKAFVVDDRLSALRRNADVKSPVIHRLRIGRPVFIFASKTSGPDRPDFTALPCRAGLAGGFTKPPLRCRDERAKMSVS